MLFSDERGAIDEGVNEADKGCGLGPFETSCDRNWIGSKFFVASFIFSCFISIVTNL
jgi:hypothetical protein